MFEIEHFGQTTLAGVVEAVDADGKIFMSNLN
jgi:hypothetical protein